ncbi:chemotaxis protein CheW [Acetobacterium bakii]|uniref:chemotaxis protein CheW n=1 Tax=Acetobacterium bakii TaxID=52689 RepID=UPI000681B975|nr:chemotaxis protein CheW [Acetobacterium bakii]
MIIYKQQDFLSHMPDVLKCEESITALNDQWDNIKLLCEINCPIQSKNVLPNMTKIQNSFYNLQQELISALGSEKLKKTEQKIISKTQVAIDILIRNLYERTADIGFIATDDDIRKFVSNEDPSEQSRNDIIKRLNEYVAKYSVYGEIVILDQNYRVLANLDQGNDILGLTLDDPILTKTMESNESFIESYQPSALQSNRYKSHVFSSKIYEEGSHYPIGIICLCFRFENEMKQIFKNLARDYDGSVITIVDNDNLVIASSDENHVPTGITIESPEPETYGVEYYRGSAYISKTVFTKGYQEYFGLGWKGHIMLPLNLAFKDTTDLEHIDSVTTRKLMGMADSFSVALNEIIVKTQTINGSLKRIVYNGQVIEKDDAIKNEYARLKPILSAIGRIGTKTSNLFQSSVSNLFSTVVSASLVETRFLASLSVDIMDRNLYERANDCRWWALNSSFRKALSHEGEMNPSDLQEMTTILAYINSLYTVYSNLFIFDHTGTIIAVSNPERSEDIGKTLSNSYIQQVLSNSNPGKYVVSPFEATDLYDNRHTYIYGASITDSRNPNRTVGGIGIVFDSQSQFKDMLEEVLESKNDTFAVFTDRSKNIIASTDENHKIGSALNLPHEMFTLLTGTQESKILEYHDCCYSVGRACSSHYREYKSTDGYQNDILGFVFEKLSDINQTKTLASKIQDIEQSDFNYSMTDNLQKLATFVMNGQVFGLDESVVLEAMDCEHIITLPGSTDNIKGAVEYNGSYIVVVNTHEIFSMKAENNGNSDDSHLLVLKLSDDELLALHVDNLMSVVEINVDDIAPVSLSSAVSGIICLSDNSNRTILVLDHHIFLEKLADNELGDDWEETLPLIENLTNPV